MIETLGQQLPVVLVENVEQVEGLLAVCARLRLHGFADEEVLQDGQQRLGDDHRGEEYDGDGPREREQEVVELSLHHDEEGEERH